MISSQNCVETVEYLFAMEFLSTFPLQKNPVFVQNISNRTLPSMNIETGHETCPCTRLCGAGLTVIPGGFPHGIDTFVSFGESPLPVLEFQ